MSPAQVSLRFVWVVLVAFVSLSLIRAESTLHFPRLSFQAGTLTGVAIVNPTSQQATVTIRAYGADGSLLSGVTNPVMETISANQQFSKLTSELFGEGLAEDTVAWFEVTSATDDLTGFWLFLNTEFTIFDGADLPVPSRNLTFSQVRTASGYATELNLINTEGSQAFVDLNLVRSGETTLTRSTTINAKGVVQIDPDALFGVAAVPAGSYVTVSADRELAGFQFVFTPPGDVVGLNARPDTEELGVLHFPQMAVLGPFDTEVGVINTSDQAVVLTLSAFTGGGDLYGPENLTTNPVTRSLSPGQGLVENIATLFGFSGENTLDGWMKVESTSESITGFLTYGLPSLGSAATVTPTRQGSNTALFSHIATISGFFTGVAMLNPGQLAANLRVLAIQPDGTVLGSHETVLRPGERISMLINELIPEAADQSGGLIFVRSDLPVYLTSLFGSTAVLSNIPPQVSPAGYAPDLSLGEIAIDPPVAVVQPGNVQTFSVAGAAGETTWKVNGIVGGNAVVGTIDAAGSFTAPPQVPFPRVVTVSADVENRSAGASVDVLEKEALLTSSQVVQSVVFLRSLENIYSAELTLVGGLGRQDLEPLQDVEKTEIFVLTSPGASKATVAEFPGEKISKLIPYTASDSTEFLLASIQNTGRIVRVHPQTGARFEVLTGLNEPTALVLNPITGNLLVAEQDKVTAVTRSEIEADILTASGLLPAAGPVTTATGGGGVAVDQCTGNIFVADTAGDRVLRLVPDSGELQVAFSGIQDPGQILVLYRAGVSCPESFQMIVVEAGSDRLTLLIDADGSVTPWIPASGSTDVAFLPDGSAFTGPEAPPAVLLTEFGAGSGQQLLQAGGGSVNFVGVPGLYAETPINPPPKKELPLGPAIFADESLALVVRDALGLSSGAAISQAQLQSLTTLDGTFAKIQQLDPEADPIVFLDGLEGAVNLVTLDLSGNTIREIPRLAGLTRLKTLNLRDNWVIDISPLAGLSELEDLDLADNLVQAGIIVGRGIADITPLAGLVKLRKLMLSTNRISDLAALEGLLLLEDLYLDENAIADIAPLVANTGLGSGDMLNLSMNLLDSGDCSNIQDLIGRGVSVLHDVSCP